MKLTYYGTAAAEGFPGIFCECEFCKRARALGGKNLRSRSQALVDGELLIDFPPDTLYHVYAFGLPLHKIKNLIVTHSHADHLYERDFSQRKETYAYFDGEEFPLNVYGSMPTVDKISSAIQQAGAAKQKRWELFEFTPYKMHKIGNHEVTPLKAWHDFRTLPYVYDIKNAEGKRMLYSNDTGFYPDETWQYLEQNKPYYNLVSLDCTGGIIDIDYDCHMNFKMNLEMRERLLKIGVADEKTIFVSHHFSHNGGAVYDDFAPVAAKEGFLVSHDGMEIEF